METSGCSGAVSLVCPVPLLQTSPVSVVVFSWFLSLGSFSKVSAAFIEDQLLLHNLRCGR